MQAFLITISLCCFCGRSCAPFRPPSFSGWPFSEDENCTPVLLTVQSCELTLNLQNSNASDYQRGSSQIQCHTILIHRSTERKIIHNVFPYASCAFYLQKFIILYSSQQPHVAIEHLKCEKFKQKYTLGIKYSPGFKYLVAIKNVKHLISDFYIDQLQIEMTIFQTDQIK